MSEIQVDVDRDVHDFDYDLFVIGAGSGGVRAARMAAGFGARVAVAEDLSCAKCYFSDEKVPLLSTDP